MRKIPCLFRRDFEGDRLVVNEVTPGCEWVLAGKGVATTKIDGTACMIRDGKLFKRYDRKVPKKTEGEAFTAEDFKHSPKGWEACEDGPDLVTGHWPGWVPVGDEPESKWHREALECEREALDDGTYELVGPKVNGNPYGFADDQPHILCRHGAVHLETVPRMFDAMKRWLEFAPMEGIVFHHEDGRMCKIRRRDFGFDWPVLWTEEDIARNAATGAELDYMFGEES